MRATLLDAVLHVCSTCEPKGPASVDDVVRHAEVARGTFYKYFDSMDEALAELALHLADEMTASILPVYDTVENPVLRTATGFQIFLVRAMLQPRWASYIARLGLLRGDSLFKSKVHSDIVLGLGTGEYSVPSVEMAGDLLMGAKAEAMLRIIADGGSLAHVRGTAELVLRAFGVTPARATCAAGAALARLIEDAPGIVSWWPESAQLQG